MKKPIILFHDVQKGEAIEREMTDGEYSNYLKDEELLKQEYAQSLIKENLRLSALEKLAALGLTEDEISAL